jgi:hypothetical protein
MVKRFFVSFFFAILITTLTFSLANLQNQLEAKAQQNASNIVWGEFPSFEPKLLINYPSSGYLTWNTSFGLYTIDKSFYWFSFKDRYGVQQVSKSVFWINTTATIDIAKITNIQVTIKNDTTFQVKYSATYKGGGLDKDTVVGNFTVTFKFYKDVKPKISVQFVKDQTAWSQGGLGDFNIVWVILPTKNYLKINETSAVDYTAYASMVKVKETTAKEDKKCEIGNSANPLTWTGSWLLTFWDDVEGVSVLYAGLDKVFGRKGITVVFPVNNGQIDPSVVGTSTTSRATWYPFQRKSFYANGRHWVFYSNGTVLTYLSSTDGKTWILGWGPRACTSGEYFSIWFDGTYLHYAYAYLSSIYYRRGEPRSDGIIDWATPTDQVVSTEYNQASYPMISTDSNGYVWIGYIDFDPNTLSTYPYAIKSQYNNGTFGSGTIIKLSDTSRNTWRVSVIPLTAGKMLAIYTYNGGAVYTIRWTGSDWKMGVFTTDTIYYGYEHSAVAQGDNVHLVFLKSTGYDILYTKYNYSSNSFSAATTLQAGATSTSAPVISIDPSTNDLYVFWAGYPTANHIYYKKYTASTGQWETVVDWITESALTDNDRLTCFYQAYGNKIGLMYMTGSASPYNVVFASLNTPPTIGQFQAPSTVYANKYFFLNVTINDVDGLTQFVNATVEISNGVILKWVNSTNEFSKLQDTYGYCTLDSSGCIRTPKNSTAYILSFKIKLNWNYPEGYVSILSTNTKVFDNQGASGSNSYSNLFYFEDDLVVYSASVNDNRINPSQSITFSGTLYYQGTTVPPEDTSGITAKVNLGATLKGSTTTIGSDGGFTISFAGESSVGSYTYTVYAVTDENTVQNKTVNVIVDKDKMNSFRFSGGTLANMTFRLLSEYYSNTLNNTDLTLRVYFNNETLCSISAKSNSTGYVSVMFTKNIVKNGTLTFNLTDVDGIVSYSYSCPVYVYVENVEVYSIDPMILYTGDSLTITMLYKSKANINGTYLALSNIYWKALIYTDRYYGYYAFPIYNGTFANILESKTLSMPIALSEGSYMLNMTFYIRGSDELLGSATSSYFVVKSRPSGSGGAPANIVKLPLTVVIRDSKGKFVEGVNIIITDMYNGTVWSGNTDVWGSVMITLNPGTYTVIVRYDNQTLTDSVVISDQPVTKEFTLQAPISITPVTVALDNYSILWLSFGILGAIGAVILERKEKTYLAIPLGLFTIGAVLHSLLVMTHQMPPFFTIPQFDLSSLLKVPSFSLPSPPQLSLDMQTLTLIVVGIIVPIVIAYYITQRGGTHKRRVRVGKFGTERRRVWK